MTGSPLQKGASFVPLIPPDRNVPANREFVSEPMTGFEWGADKQRIEFYVLKGDREVRSWVAEKDDGPEANVSAAGGSLSTSVQAMRDGRHLGLWGRMAPYRRSCRMQSASDFCAH